MTSKMGTHLGIFRARTALMVHLDTMRVQAPAEAQFIELRDGQIYRWRA